MKRFASKWRYSLIAILSLLFYSGCSSDSSSGSSGNHTATNILIQGPITAKGSIVVNGIELDTTGSAIMVDDSPGSESSLVVGMTVNVGGAVDDSGQHGVAYSVIYDDEVQGAISGLTDNGLNKNFTVLGQNVVADITSTIFYNTTYAALVNGDIVEVSGTLLNDGTIIATRIEDKGGTAEVEKKGLISALSGNTFVLGTTPVDATSSTFEPNDLVLADGLFVEVKGTLSGDTIIATLVQREDNGFDDNISKVSLEGIISGYTSDASFFLNGQEIDASSATRTPLTLVLNDNVPIEAEGPIINGILLAQKVEGRHEELKFNAEVTAKGTNTLTLTFNPGTVTLYVDSSTEFRDVAFDNITINSFVLAEGMDANGYIILAKLDAGQNDREIIQGRVNAYTVGSAITIENLLYTINGTTQFQNNVGSPISESDFAALYNQPGTLVKVKDRPIDGIADEISLEEED